MITSKERKAIKKLFGIGFSQKIASRLKDKDVQNTKGDFFKASSISDVLNGRNHSILEEEIRNVWKEEVEQKEENMEEMLKRTHALVQ